MAIWKSAAFGWSPPITPCAIRLSTWSSRPGTAARSAWTASGVALLIFFSAQMIGAAVAAATEVGMPSL